MRTLFITRDGPGLTYLESLFVPIFARLAEQGFPFDVLQFRWGERAEQDRARQACEAVGIGYQSAPIWRKPGGAGPLASAIYGRRAVARAARNFGSNALMPRTSLAALSVPSDTRNGGLPIIYDSDGLDIDERVDFAGLSSSSKTYRWMRDIESQAVRDAVAVLVRTEAGRDIMLARAGPPVAADRFQIVTNGRDEQVFHPHGAEARAGVRRELGIATDAPLIVYAGTVGFRQRTESVIKFAEALRARAPTAHLLVLSGTPEDARAILMQTCPAAASYTTIRSAQPGEVPLYLAAGDVGATFVRKAFSTQGVAPLKTAEYLLCGVPIVGTPEIGDTREAIARGVFFGEEHGLDAAAKWVTDSIQPNREKHRAAARALGVERFSLARAVQDYAAALARVSGPTPAP